MVINLTEAEYNAILEARWDGFMRMNGIKTTKPIGKYLRYIDVYEKQKKMGKISDDEYKHKVAKLIRHAKDKVEDTNSENGNKNLKLLYNYASTKNRENYDRETDTRLNKSKVDYSGIQHKQNPNDPNKTHIDFSKLSPEAKSKIERKIKILQSTDDYNDYKQHYKDLAKMLNVSPEDAIGIDKGLSGAFSYHAGDNTGQAQSKELYHTSNKNDITALRPSYRGVGYMLYPRKRIYAAEDQPMSRSGKKEDLKDDAIYKLKTNNNKSNVKSDREYSDDKKARYIETDYNIPVTQTQRKK